MLQCVAVCCSVLQCVAVCCSVFQCVVFAVLGLGEEETRENGVYHRSCAKMTALYYNTDEANIHP